MNKKTIIGNTPMIKIYYKYKRKKGYVYAKLEYFNLTGSIKDRVAYYIIKNAYKRNELKKGVPIIEATSGNTGISLSAFGAYFNHPVVIFMPDWVSKERMELMKGYGATIKLISKEEGGFKRCVSEAKKLAIETKGFLANQFASHDNFLAHYETTGKEIISQLKENVYAFISGVGTGGTLMGTGKRLKKKFKDLKVVALEPDKMPIISKSKILGQHKIEGIGDDFVPDLIDKNFIDDYILIDDDDAINMSKKLVKELGIGVGISSGANLLASIIEQDKIKKPVVTIFPDDNKKYLSTNLFKTNDKNKKLISEEITLLKYEII